MPKPGCVEAAAAELLAEEEPPCSAEGSRTEPEPDAAPEEGEEDEAEGGSALGTLATLFAAGVSGCCHSGYSSSGMSVRSWSMPGRVEVLSGVFRPSRFSFSSSRTVRTAQTPAAAAATKHASSASTNPLSRRNFRNCSMVRYSNHRLCTVQILMVVCDPCGDFIQFGA